ncbi:MAG: metallopeptidase family protein [Gemmatimonadota bacterium]|nr:metallopeptidase family protein [Gemmatimonadota bacterium]
MTFEAFERMAREIYDEIPDVYRDGVDGLRVSRDAPRHPDHPGVYTLGECLTEEHLSDYGSAETTRSVIALYWGSFRALANQHEDFDWEGEAWETLTHELRHHLESLAGDDALEGVDYAADQSFKRFDGDPFDPWYYQHGEERSPGVYQVEGSWYIEVELPGHALEHDASIEFEWEGRRYRVPTPAEAADVHFVLLDGLGDRDGTVELVVVRSAGWWENLRRTLGLTRPTVAEWEAEAQPLDP